MTTLFDGLAGIAAGVLGAPVTYAPTGGAVRAVVSILRERPVQVTGADGVDVLITAPTWRVRRDLVPEIARADRVARGDKIWRVLNIWPQGSTASDAHLVCELDRVQS